MSTSVSDLAPFVAAVLRDRVTNDLLAENRRLRTEGPTWAIAITGPGGAPVYATGTVLHRELLRIGGPDDDYDGLPYCVGVSLEDGATACRRDSLRGCRLVLTPEAGVGQERVYNFENELHDDSAVDMDHISSPGNVMCCDVDLASFGDLFLEVPLLTGHDFEDVPPYVLSEVEANTYPGAPIRFLSLFFKRLRGGLTRAGASEE